MATCGWCELPFIARRRDALYCRKACRQAAHRAKISRATIERAAAPLRLAYADPPYPGKSRLYRDHPDYAGEVDHPALIRRLAESFDGWALSTSAEALPLVLGLVTATERRPVFVAPWVKPRPAPHPTARVLNRWEPLIVCPARDLPRPPRTRPAVDVLERVASRRRPTRPGAVVGMKPPAFCVWLFELLGARPGDELHDLFPGSGMVAWSWVRWAGPAAPAPEPMVLGL